MTGIYQARTRTSVAPTENRPEVDVSLSFIDLFPCLHSQQHFQLCFKPPCTPFLHHLISGISPDCCRIMLRFFKTRLKLRVATQSNEKGLNPVVTDSARDTVHPALEIHSTTPVWPGADYSMPKVLGHQAARRDRGSNTGPPRLPSSH